MDDLEKALAAVDTGIDLFEIFERPVEEMSDDEIDQVYTVLQKLRRKKTKRTKSSTQLDILLKKLTPDMAQAILAQLNKQKGLK